MATAARTKYQQANRERINAQARAWRAANQEKSKASTDRYWKSNLDKRRVLCARRRARKLNQFIEDVNPQVLYRMWGGMCGICKGFIEGDFHVDHRVPLSRGGMHGYINCQPAHPACNLRKGANV